MPATHGLQSERHEACPATQMAVLPRCSGHGGAARRRRRARGGVATLDPLFLPDCWKDPWVCDVITIFMYTCSLYMVP